MYWSNTTLFDVRYKYIYIYIRRIYYIKINYMFRPLTMAIFRLRLKKKLSKQLYSAYAGCIQPIYVEYSCLLSFFQSQPEDEFTT